MGAEDDIINLSTASPIQGFPINDFRKVLDEVLGGMGKSIHVS